MKCAMDMCEEYDQAFAAIRSGRNCRPFLTHLLTSDINRCYQGDYLLSAAVNVYLKKSKCFENIKCLLEFGATPLCGSWNYCGVYLNDCPFDFTSEWKTVRGTEIAAMVDDLALLKVLVTSTKCNELHLTCALKMARADSKHYLQAVLDQLQLISPTLFRPYSIRSKTGISYFLSLAPLAPILILKKMEDENLRELLNLYRDVMRSLRSVRMVFFNKDSPASVLPLDVVKAATSYLVQFNPQELARLKEYGKILEKGLMLDTYFSFVCGFRVQLPSKRHTLW